MVTAHPAAADVVPLRIPMNAMAERAVLGACLVSESALLQAIDAGLRPESFYADPHRVIWARMLDLGVNGGGLDVVTLRSSLDAVGELAQAGGLSYLVQLSEATPDVAHVAHHAELVLEQARKRQLLQLGQELVGLAAAEDQPARAVFDRAADRLLAVHDGRDADEMDLAAAAVEEVGRLRAIARHEIEDRRVHLGLPLVDQAMGGMEGGELALVAGRPGVGKTAFLTGVVQSACEAGLSVLLWSGEMSRRQMVWRILSRLTGIGLRSIKRGLLTPAEWTSIEMAQRTIQRGWALRFVEGDITPSRLRVRCRSRQLRRGLDLVVVDYLQLMRPDGRVENRTQEVGAVSRGLKALALGLGVPVLAGAQLSREIEKDHGAKGPRRRPRLSDLRESGSLEQDSDLVMFLERIPDGTPEQRRAATLYLAKARNEEVNDWPLAYDPPTCRFSEGLR